MALDSGLDSGPDLGLDSGRELLGTTTFLLMPGIYVFKILPSGVTALYILFGITQNSLLSPSFLRFICCFAVPDLLIYRAVVFVLDGAVLAAVLLGGVFCCHSAGRRSFGYVFFVCCRGQRVSLRRNSSLSLIAIDINAQFMITYRYHKCK